MGGEWAAEQWTRGRTLLVHRLVRRCGPLSPASLGGCRSAALEAQHSGARILLVEDEPINQEIAATLLEDVDLSTSSATASKACCPGPREWTIALIFMDMQMPHMDGTDYAGNPAAAGLVGTPHRGP